MATRVLEAVDVDALLACQRLVPELTDKLQTRYRILQQIVLHQPIGRRTLAHVLNTTERILRADVELFKEQGLIDVGPLGMTVTEAGISLMADLDTLVRLLDGRHQTGLRLQEVLSIDRIVVVSGDSEKEDSALREMGQAAADVLRGYLQPGSTVAVTGGTTMAVMADSMPRVTTLSDILVLPARGGLGERVELLAGTIASRLAEKLGGTYRMFHVPESLSPETAQTLSMEPTVQEIADQIRGADIVIHGIGEALTMAKRRRLDEETVQLLQDKGAVAEAFGYFFDESGRIVHVMNTVGLRLEDLARIPVVIGVAGGGAKWAAIRAAARAYRMDALITDEGASTALVSSVEWQVLQDGSDVLDRV